MTKHMTRHMIHQRSAAEPASPMVETVYNLFRRKRGPELFCAVPETCPVPRFVTGAVWHYAGTLRKGDERPRGFDEAAAELGAEMNGFHLFQAAGPVPAGRLPGLRRAAPPRHPHPTRFRAILTKISDGQTISTSSSSWPAYDGADGLDASRS